MKKETLHHNITNTEEKVNGNSSVGCSVFNEYVQSPPTGQEWNYSQIYSGSPTEMCQNVKVVKMVV